MKKTITKISLILLSVIFLSGCISVSIEQEILENRNSEISLIYDMSALKEQTESFNSEFSSETKESKEQEDLCEEYKNFSKKYNFNCKFSENFILTLKGEWLISEENFKIKNSLFKTTYTYNPNDIFTLLEKTSEDSSEDMQFDKNQLSSFKQIPGISFNYKVKMPGILKSTEISSITKDYVKIDLLELNPNEEYKIISEKTNKNNIILSSLLIILIIIGGIFWIIKNKKTEIPKPNENNQISQNELKCKDYILKYKNSFSKESILESLKQTQISEKEIIKYIEKYY